MNRINQHDENDNEVINNKCIKSDEIENAEEENLCYSHNESSITLITLVQE